MLSPTRKQLSDWAKLTQKKYRRESGLFLIEGEICVNEAIRARIRLDAVILSPEREDAPKTKAPLYEVNQETFQRITNVETSQGIVAVGKQFRLPPRNSNIAIAVEQVSDPGNCGALIRVADFFGASELILGKDSTEIWNGKVVRGSMGSIFHQPIRELDSLDSFIKNWKGDTVAVVAHGGEPLAKKLKLKSPTLLVLGHETRGLSPEIEKLCSHKITLEPRGDAESLNLVTAAAVFSFAITQE